MQIDSIWQFGLRLTNTAFKPALGELRKKHPVCTKIRLFEIQNRKFFLGLPRPLPQWGGGHPLPTPNPLRRLRRLNLRAYRSHTSFFRKRSLAYSIAGACPGWVRGVQLINPTLTLTLTLTWRNTMIDWLIDWLILCRRTHHWQYGRCCPTWLSLRFMPSWLEDSRLSLAASSQPTYFLVSVLSFSWLLCLVTWSAQSWGY